MIRMLTPLLAAMEASTDLIGARVDSIAEHERILAAVRGHHGTRAASATATHFETVAARRRKSRPPTGTR